MPGAREIQKSLKEKLSVYFGEVETEWSISRDATDAFRRRINFYKPRLDIAVGPFNVESGAPADLESYFRQNAPNRLKNRLVGLQTNNNPRCVLAIEVVCSGSSKHILGDTTNASLMGLYGLVVTNTQLLGRTRRIHRYLETARAVGKAPSELFRNVAVISYEKLDQLL